MDQKPSSYGNQFAFLTDENFLKQIRQAERVLKELKPILDLVASKEEGEDWKSRTLIPSLNKRSMQRNAKYGWTMAHQITLAKYFDTRDLEDCLDAFDSYFVSCYEENNQRLYQEQRNINLFEIDIKQRRILEQCYTAYEQEMYQIVIPSLLLLIEGVMAHLLDTNAFGGKLKEELKKLTDVDRELDDRESILYSTTVFITDHLFKKHDFLQERLEIINRNWILHGRDDPSKWTKADALRLFNVLSSLLFVLKEDIN